MAWGVVDALVYYKPNRRKDPTEVPEDLLRKMKENQDKATSLRFAPYLDQLDEKRVFGLQTRWEF